MISPYTNDSPKKIPYKIKVFETLNETYKTQDK